MHAALEVVDDLGWEVNIYGVPDLESFLEAALLLPASVTADFNCAEWNYDGRDRPAERPIDPSDELGNPAGPSGRPKPPRAWRR
jgi:hypothetical protein